MEAAHGSSPCTIWGQWAARWTLRAVHVADARCTVLIFIVTLTHFSVFPFFCFGKSKKREVQGRHQRPEYRVLMHCETHSYADQSVCGMCDETHGKDSSLVCTWASGEHKYERPRVAFCNAASFILHFDLFYLAWDPHLSILRITPGLWNHSWIVLGVGLG